MIPAKTLAVSGERLRATYDLAFTRGDARERAAAIAVEQTIEFPADLIADDDIRRHVIGRVESVEAISATHSRAVISYASETTGG